MLNIAVFVSDHGFGHIMRILPVAGELLSRGHQVTIITGRKQAVIADQYLNGRAEIIVCHTDAGLSVKLGTLLIDREATTAEVRSHVGRWPELIGSAPDADVYVVDIVPWALQAAKERGIPSFLLVNFTWIDQYEDFLPFDLLEKYRGAFACADKIFYYDLANEKTRKLLGPGEDIGFVARPFNMEEVKRIRGSHKNKTVFVSLGASNDGLDLEIDVEGLPYDFISTQALHLKGNNVEYLDRSVPNSQDYVKAADFCITKAGWSTVSEVMLAGVPLAVLEREDTPEDTMTIEKLKKRHAAITITADDLKDMRGILDRMEQYEWSRRVYKNQYQRIADRILK